MKKCLCFCVLFLIFIGTAYSQEVPPLTIDELKQQADSVLSLSNVSARKKIDVVFELADRLLEENQNDTAEHYLAEGLKHFPWDLEHQVVYAKLLAAKGKIDLSGEIAAMVLKYAETDRLIEQAGQLLGRPPASDIPGIHPLPGTEYQVVLIPLQNCEKWLISSMRDQLSETLKIPVHIQSIDTEYPTFHRDLRGQILNKIRNNIISDGLEDSQVKAAMTQLSLSREDLNNEKSLIDLMEHLLAAAGPAAVDQFLAALESSVGKDPQWDADQLLVLLFDAIRPYRRPRIAYLGVTSADIYADDYNFLFGWANPQGGVMSYRRFTAAFTDETPNQARLIKRASMQALSSIGHIFGVERCTNPTCARAYPHSLTEHDAKEGNLCPLCKNGFKDMFKVGEK
jgi:predicted Zn-dependent protease